MSPERHFTRSNSCTSDSSRTAGCRIPREMEMAETTMVQCADCGKSYPLGFLMKDADTGEKQLRRRRNEKGEVVDWTYTCPTCRSRIGPGDVPLSALLVGCEIEE